MVAGTISGVCAEAIVVLLFPAVGDGVEEALDQQTSALKACWLLYYVDSMRLEFFSACKEQNKRTSRIANARRSIRNGNKIK